MKEITITGCNNCPFRPMEYDLGDCNLFIHLFPNELDSHIKIYDLANEYRADIPKECPMSKEGLIIKPKE